MPHSGPRHPSCTDLKAWCFNIKGAQKSNYLYIKMNEPQSISVSNSPQFTYISQCKYLNAELNYFCFSLIFSCRVPSRLLSRAECCSLCWARLSLFSLFHPAPVSRLTLYLSHIRPGWGFQGAQPVHSPKRRLTPPAPHHKRTSKNSGDEKLSCCAHIWNLSDDKIINVEANIVSDILSQPWELSQSQFLILKAQE